MSFLLLQNSTILDVAALVDSPIPSCFICVAFTWACFSFQTKISSLDLQVVDWTMLANNYAKRKCALIAHFLSHEKKAKTGNFLFQAKHLNAF